MVFAFTKLVPSLIFGSLTSILARETKLINVIASLLCSGLSICHNFVCKHQNYSTNHVLLSNDSSMWGVHTIHCYFLLGLPCDFMSILGGSFWPHLAFWKLNYFVSRHHMTHDAIWYLPPCIVLISLE